MSIVFTCTRCESEISVPDSAAGRQGTCGKCGALVVAPLLSSLTSTAQPALKTCPYCAEVVRAEAIVCKHCKSNLFTAPKKTQGSATAVGPPTVTAGEMGKELPNVQTMQVGSGKQYFVWACACIPILWMWLPMIGVIPAILINIVILSLDEKSLRERGIDTTTLGNYWLIPLYLWNRAKLLGEDPSYFWVWAVATGISLFV